MKEISNRKFLRDWIFPQKQTKNWNLSKNMFQKRLLNIFETFISSNDHETE